ncbi:MAG TPA: hypothetical protein ENI49_06180 [Thermoplasmatales archaeon]|nr:hypothetical protein [Thermoplasmatales archaeon]
MVLNRNIRVSEETKKKLLEIGKKGDTYDDIIRYLLDNFDNKRGNRKIVISGKTERKEQRGEEKTITISEQDIFGEWDSEKAKKIGW